MQAFYDINHVTLIRIPYDAGVAASRNQLVRAIKEDYFVLCDDDFIIGPQTRFHEALHICKDIRKSVWWAAGCTTRRPRGIDTELGNISGARHCSWNAFQHSVSKDYPRVREAGGTRFYLSTVY